MKLISSILFTAMVLAVSCVYGQDTKPKKAKSVFSAKLYAVSEFVSNKALSRGGIDVQIPRSFSPTIAWGREYGNYNEVELTDFKFKNNFSNKVLNLGARYSYNWRLFNKSETSKFSYFIGAGAGVNHYYMNNDWYYDSEHNFSSRSFQMSASIIPRVNMKIAKRMYLDLNLPFNIYSHSFYKNESGYPANVTIDQGNIGDAFSNKFTVNVGIAIKF